VFNGHYRNSINDKGRLSIPSKFRDLIGEPGCIVLGKTLHESCLTAYTLDHWERLLEKTAKLSTTKEALMYYRRHVIGSAEECQIDPQGRVLIPAHLREHAALSGKCQIVGIGERFEIWNEDAYEAYLKRMEAKEDLMAVLEGLDL
jgi:MraZ protein